DEFQRKVLAARRFEIERHAALIAVGAQMQHALAVPPDVAARPVALPSAFRRLDRDHLGAEIGERLDAPGDEQEMGAADDANSLQQVEHAGCWGGGGARKGAGAHYARWARPTAMRGVVPAKSLPRT